MICNISLTPAHEFAISNSLLYSTVHLFGTILPLVFSIMLSNHVSWFSTFFLEVLINATVPVSHFLYCVWSFHLPNRHIDQATAATVARGRVSSFSASVGSTADSFRSANEEEEDEDELPSPSVIESEGSSSSSEPASEKNISVPPTHIRVTSDLTSTTTGEDEDDDSRAEDEGILPKKYRIQKVERYLGSGFVLALFILGFVPHMYMPECDAPPCLKQRYVSKTSILALSDEMLESGGTIKEAVQSLPGLIELHVDLARHNMEDDKYVMVEVWSDKDNMTMTEDVLSYFIDTSEGNAIIDEAKQIQHLDVATVNKKQCASEMIDSIELQPQFSCKKLWRVLDSPGYCAWIPGCEFAATQSESSNYAQLHMRDGTIIPAVIAKNEEEKKISVSVLSQTDLPGYKAVMTLEKSGGGIFPWSSGNKSCNLKYEFRMNGASPTSPSKRSDINFNEYFLPDLYTKLSQK